MKIHRTVLAGAAVVALVAVHAFPADAAADPCAVLCAKRHPGIWAWLRPGCIATCKALELGKQVVQGIAKGAQKATAAVVGVVKKGVTVMKKGAEQLARGAQQIAGKVAQGIGAAFQLVTGGIVKVFTDLKDLIACVGQKGKMDVIKMFSTFVGSPLGFLKTLFNDVLRHFGAVVSGLVAKGGESLGALIGAATGGNVSKEAIAGFGEWVWSQFEALGKQVGALGCLVQFLRPVKAAMDAVYNWLVPTILTAWGKLYRDHVEPAITGWLAKGFDAVVKLVLGETGKARLKLVLGKALNPDARAKQAARALGVFTKTLSSGSGDLKKAWLDARALLTTAEDFGVRRIVGAAKEGVKYLVELIIDKAAPQVVDWGLKAVSSGVTLLNGVIDGACGLIPEVGAAICTVITRGLRVVYEFVGSTMLKTLILKGIDIAVKPLVGLVVDLVGNKVQALVTKQVDKVVAGSGAAQVLLKLLQPAIDLVLNVVTKWALPEVKTQAAVQRAVVELGDEVVKLAPTAQPAPKPAPVPAGEEPVSAR
jgi:hypothetical protein